MKKIILTEGTEFEQNMKDLALIDTDFREGKPTMLDSDEVNTAFSNSDQAVKDKFNFDLNGEEINITPSTSQQVITPSQGKNAITKATVAAVTSSIDSNIVAGNIKKDVSILGVTGSVVELAGETIEVTPTTSSQTITPSNGKNGITEVSVSAVTSTIDANIVPGNIKSGVTILGVEGTYTGE